MRSMGLGKILARVVAMALPLAGCCETSHPSIEVNAAGQRFDANSNLPDAGTVPPGALDCQSLCAPALVGSCTSWDIDTCERLDPDGRTVTCRYVDTECPDRLPIPRGSCGRRTEGVGLAAVTGGAALGRALAAMATLEAASVPAFARLGRELSAHGAPVSLRRAAEGARQDEVRHARVMRELAKSHGARVGRLAARAPRSTRSLAEVARENAVEGCVRETWGAATAAFQARAAGDPAVRRALTAIARDEARHAALAWRVHAWALAQMGDGDRSACERALRDEATALRRELAAAADDATARALGTPAGAAARAMAAALDGALWGRA